MGPYCLTIIDHFWQHTSCQANPAKKIDYLVQVRLMCNSKWGRTSSIKKIMLSLIIIKKNRTNDSIHI